MIESATAGAALQIPPGKGLKISSGGNENKSKLDLNSAPESKVKVQAPGSAGPGKGLKIDIQA